MGSRRNLLDSAKERKRNNKVRKSFFDGEFVMSNVFILFLGSVTSIRTKI